MPSIFVLRGVTSGAHPVQLPLIQNDTVPITGLLLGAVAIRASGLPFSPNILCNSPCKRSLRGSSCQRRALSEAALGAPVGQSLTFLG